VSAAEHTCRGEGAIPSAAKLVAYHLLNDECLVAERSLFALVGAVACLLAHDGSEETARLAFETVVRPAVALAAVRTLLGEDR